MRKIALFPCGGIGSRFPSLIFPKEFLPVGEDRVCISSSIGLINSVGIEKAVIVANNKKLKFFPFYSEALFQKKSTLKQVTIIPTDPMEDRFGIPITLSQVFKSGMAFQDDDLFFMFLSDVVYGYSESYISSLLMLVEYLEKDGNLDGKRVTLLCSIKEDSQNYDVLKLIDGKWRIFVKPKDEKYSKLPAWVAAIFSGRFLRFVDKFCESSEDIELMKRFAERGDDKYQLGAAFDYISRTPEISFKLEHLNGLQTTDIGSFEKYEDFMRS